jgi:FkbH-like protein
MNYISSNFNLMATNSYWDKLKKNHTLIDKNYNGIILSLNKKKLESHSFFHFIFYVDGSNFDQTIKELKNLIQIIKNHKKKKFFLYFFIKFYENPTQEKLFNDKFLKIKFDLDNLYVKNFHQSNNKLFSERNKVFIRFPFELKFINFISSEIKKNITFFSSKPYKLIILDCDNTLWKGVLDEDGYQNIKYNGDGEGQIFYQFQLYLKKKKKEGFVLSISSKNTESNVWEAMKKRDMILQKKDFINPKINWYDKAVNIKQIINQLTLRSKDCLFIDDNPLEIEKVKSQIKGINTINVKDSLEILEKVNKDPRLFKHEVLKEDLNKYKQYNLKSKFENIFEKSAHSFNFYKKLKQKIKFEIIQEKNFDRAIQLFNKTNQFNFNLNRYTDISLKKLIKNQMYSTKLISFKDKFGDHGIIGAYIIKKKKLSIEIIDFVLSCRVLNRYLEELIIIKIIKDYSNKNLSIFFKKEQVNNELIPAFLKKNYFKFKKKNKNIYEYGLSLTNNYHEIEKIFRY